MHPRSEPGPCPAPGLSRERARALALDVGFSEAGVVGLGYAHQERDAARYEEWVRAGRAGSMGYLERTDEEGQLLRARVRVPFPWARSVLVCFAGYDSRQPRSIDPAPEDAGWIARYAWSSKPETDSNAAEGARKPSDYHKVLLKRMKAVEARLHEELGAFESRAFVDTGPVVERSLATAAGLGWTGKNTCLIHPRLGSFGFLAVLLTSLPLLEKDSPTAQVPDRCGSCTRCIEACPTDALIAPYQMDATRCISYLTIEHKGTIAPELMPGMGRQIFGCDICQDVCPWNRKAVLQWDAPGANSNAHLKADPELEPRAELVNPALEWLSALDEPSFERLFNGSPVRRAGFLGLQRNTAIAMGNSGRKQFVPRLESWAQNADEGLRTAARWALGKLRGEKLQRNS